MIRAMRCNKAYSAFVSKKINYTEFIVFLILASEARFGNTPNSPDECNKVVLNGKKIEKLASILDIGVSTLYRSISNLCSYYFLHKIEGESGEYIINPFLAAKGDHAKIEKLREKILPTYFDIMADGDILIQSDFEALKVITVYKLTGEFIVSNVA